MGEKEDCKQCSKMNKDSKYPSSKLMLDIIIKNYEFEENRKNSIESRSGILLSLVGALLAFIPSTITLPNFSKLLGRSFKYFILPGITLILFILSFVILIISITYFVKSISTKDYKKLSSKDFNNNNAAADEDKTAFCLMCRYTESTDHNNDTNNRKVNSFNTAINFFKYALILEAAMFILKIILDTKGA